MDESGIVRIRETVNPKTKDPIEFKMDLPINGKLPVANL